MTTTPVPGARHSRYTLTAFLAVGVGLWGLALSLWAASGDAQADQAPAFRDVDALLLVPRDGTWFYVQFAFFMQDRGDGRFAEEAAAVRAATIQRFPGAVEVAPESAEAAFVTAGFKWTSGSASWSYNSAGAPTGVAGGAGGAIQSAASSWGQQGAQFAFSGGGSTTADTGACGSGTDGANTVGWKAQAGSSVLAITCSWNRYGTPFRSATEFDMELDPDWNWTTSGTTQVDLQSVALHEFGHALGLEHSPLAAAVMYATYRNGTEKRIPAQDDIDGLIAIYGAQGATATSTAAPTSTPTSPPPSTPSPTPTPTPSPIPSATFSPSPTTVIPPLTPTPTPSVASPSPLPTSTPTQTSTPAATPTPPTNTAGFLPIPSGVSLLVWPGDDGPIAPALGGVAGLHVVYAFDPAEGSWSRYAPAGPSFLNNLATLRKGVAYWFVSSASAQVPYAP